MSVGDGFPSDRLPLAGGLLQRLGNSVVASRGADATFLWDRGRPTNTKLLHPVGQRRSLHPQANVVGLQDEEANDVRFIPKRAAAPLCPPITQLLASSTRRI